LAEVEYKITHRLQHYPRVQTDILSMSRLSLYPCGPPINIPAAPRVSLSLSLSLSLPSFFVVAFRHVFTSVRFDDLHQHVVLCEALKLREATPAGPSRER